ncbi:MAG: FHA domain-containing protein [Acidobacteria bacterium]|nr:FHA domain-containing protein [Acidobacteriota bacterium]
MTDELQEVDTAAIEELQKLKREQEVLSGRLGRMEDKRGKVTDEVYARVRGDYERRIAELEEKARPLKQQARAEYAKLKAIYERIEAIAKSVSLNKEELELRHELGEFEDEEFKGKLTEHEMSLDQHQQELADALKLKERFVAAFPSEDDLDQPGSPGPPPTSAKAATEKTKAGAGGVSDATAAIPVAEDAGGGETMLIRWPKLIGQGEDGSTVEYPVAGNVTSLGRGPENDVVLAGKTVAKRHAEVALTSKGYLIRAADDKASVLVNGETVKQRLLANGDSIQVGEVVLVFMEI